MSERVIRFDSIGFDYAEQVSHAPAPVLLMIGLIDTWMGLDAGLVRR